MYHMCILFFNNNVLHYSIRIYTRALLCTVLQVRWLSVKVRGYLWSSPYTGCCIKSSPPPGVFGSFLSNGLEFKCEILYTYVDIINVPYILLLT